MAAPIVHFEIGVKDAEKAKAFYGPLFGWQFEQYGMATMVTNIGAMCPGGTGIGGHVNQLPHPPHNYVTVYAQVDDLEATLKKVESLGGSRLVPVTEVPGMGWFAWFKDPEGNCLGLWKSMAR